MADDKPDPKRDALHEAIQQHGRYEDDSAVLTGWAIVTEWMNDKGDRWLSKGHAAHTAHWAAKGMMHEALFGEWPDPDDSPLDSRAAAGGGATAARAQTPACTSSPASNRGP